MQHAESHLTDVKEALETQEDKLNQEKIITEKTIADLKTQVDFLNQKIDEKTRENQVLQTNLAVANERFQNQSDEISTLKQQNELRLKHLNDEKHQVIDEVSKLQAVIAQYKNDLSIQTEKHQSALANERALQEESEIRWVQIIDQAKLETKNSQKKYDEMDRKQNDKINALQNNLIKLQDTLTTAQITLNYKNEMTVVQNKQLEKAQRDYTEAITELAILKSRLVPNSMKNTTNKHKKAKI